MLLFDQRPCVSERLAHRVDGKLQTAVLQGTPHEFCIVRIVVQVENAQRRAHGVLISAWPNTVNRTARI